MLTILAILGLLAIAGVLLRDRLDPTAARRAALHDALDRGEIQPEDYARALQSPV